MRALASLTMLFAFSCAHHTCTKGAAASDSAPNAADGPRTPEAAVGAYFGVMRNPTVDGIWALMTAKDRAENDREALAASFAAATPAQRAETQARYKATPADIRITRKEDGKHASAFYPMGAERCELELEDEGGVWKVGVETCESGG